MIIYLSGAERPSVREMFKHRKDFGVIAQPGNGVHLRGPIYSAWGIDNGCFSQGENFDPDKYYHYLKKIVNRDGCLFATAPDVFANFSATWERSRDPLSTIRSIGLPSALVGQDGMTTKSTVEWDSFDCLFLGGTNDWKLSLETALVVEQALRRGKWVHMGRVNSLKRLQYARNIGCGSADGTHIKYVPDKDLHGVMHWLYTVNGHDL